jgi:hypothetical protein
VALICPHHACHSRLIPPRKRASDAVCAWRKLVFPIGPISPAAKKAGDRQIAQPIVNHVEIVIRLVEQTLASAVACEEQSREGFVVIHHLRIEQQLQVLTRRLGIADVKLHRLAHARDVAHSNAADCACRSPARCAQESRRDRSGLCIR